MVTLLLATLVGMSWAQEHKPEMDEIASIELSTEIANDIDLRTMQEAMPTTDECGQQWPPEQGASEIPVIIDEIINIGKSLWPLIERNRPSVNAKYITAYALPNGIRCWNEMENWQIPSIHNAYIKMKNLFGMDVVNVKFRLVYTHGGSYMGKGKYLTSVKVLPAKIDLSWGYTLNVNANVLNVYNMGTKDEPVAGMEFVIDWNVSTTFKYIQQTHSFHLDGTGFLQQLD